jgi:hypothetical protein
MLMWEQIINAVGMLEHALVVVDMATGMVYFSSRYYCGQYRELSCPCSISCIVFSGLRQL